MTDNEENEPLVLPPGLDCHTLARLLIDVIERKALQVEGKDRICLKRASEILLSNNGDIGTTVVDEVDAEGRSPKRIRYSEMVSCSSQTQTDFEFPVDSRFRKDLDISVNEFNAELKLHQRLDFIRKSGNGLVEVPRIRPDEIGQNGACNLDDKAVQSGSGICSGNKRVSNGLPHSENSGHLDDLFYGHLLVRAEEKPRYIPLELLVPFNVLSDPRLTIGKRAESQKVEQEERTPNDQPVGETVLPDEESRPEEHIANHEVPPTLPVEPPEVPPTLPVEPPEVPPILTDELPEVPPTLAVELPEAPPTLLADEESSVDSEDDRVTLPADDITGDLSDDDDNLELYPKVRVKTELPQENDLCNFEDDDTDDAADINRKSPDAFKVKQEASDAFKVKQEASDQPSCYPNKDSKVLPNHENISVTLNFTINDNASGNYSDIDACSTPVGVSASSPSTDTADTRFADDAMDLCLTPDSNGHSPNRPGDKNSDPAEATSATTVLKQDCGAPVLGEDDGHDPVADVHKTLYLSSMMPQLPSCEEEEITVGNKGNPSSTTLANTGTVPVIQTNSGQSVQSFLPSPQINACLPYPSNLRYPYPSNLRWPYPNNMRSHYPGVGPYSWYNPAFRCAIPYWMFNGNFGR